MSPGYDPRNSVDRRDGDRIEWQAPEVLDLQSTVTVEILMPQYADDPPLSVRQHPRLL